MAVVFFTADFLDCRTGERYLDLERDRRGPSQRGRVTTPLANEHLELTGKAAWQVIQIYRQCYKAGVLNELEQQLDSLGRMQAQFHFE